MNYQTGQAFRRALEARLLNQSSQGAVSLVRLRKLVAFDRFMARRSHSDPDARALLYLRTYRLTGGAGPLMLRCRGSYPQGGSV